MAKKRVLKQKGLAGMLKSVPGAAPRTPTFNGKPFGFTPFDSGAKPPSGTYDPSLDAALRGANRGYGDLTADVGTADLRAGSDLGLFKQQVDQQRGRLVEDTARNRNRLNEDYTSNTQALTRRYTQQGQGQAQSAQAAGAVGGGALAQALLKRTANQGIEQKGLDTSRDRGLSDLQSGQDRGLADLMRSYDQAKLGYDRGVEDRRTSVQRGGRELGAFSTDTAEQRAFQAGQSGWENRAPANEFQSPSGKAYRVIMSKDWLVGPGGKRTRKIYLTPDGRRSLVRPA